MIQNYTLSSNILEEFAKSILPVSTNDLIFVPTMRAKRKLVDYLLLHSEKKVFFLPEILSFDEAENDDEINEETISQDRRQILMTQLIQQHFPKFSIARSFNWAEKLLSLLDKITTERISIDDVESIVDEKLNDHYQHTLSFLFLLKNHWGKIVDAEGKKEAKKEKIAQLDNFISSLKNQKKGRIFAMGTTGSLPTTRKLLKEINSQKNSVIIFQGIPNYTKEEWDEVSETHHAFGFKKTLKELGENPSEIQNIGKKSEREKTIEKAFLPASKTINWNKENIIIAGIFDNLSIINAPNTQLESTAIALAVLKQKQENKKALIITGDRDLVSHLHNSFSRFGLVLEDSVQPFFTATNLGKLFQNYLNFLNEDSSQKLLTLLKSEEINFDEEELNSIELFLRKAQPESVLKDFIPAFLSLSFKDKNNIQEGYENLEKLNKNLLKLETKETSFSKHLETLLKNFKEFSKHENTQFNNLFNDIKESGKDWILSSRDFLNLLPSFIKNLSAKKTFDTKADALVLGAIEARMQTSDLVIISGLNENNFPRPTQDDPIFNEAMRTQLGLPSLSRKIGLMALDFAHAFSKKNVLLTRSLSSNGSPTQPSRFLERITAFLNKKIPESFFLKLALQQDKSENSYEKHLASFSPPMASRPTKLSASSIEMWMRDPYAFYAKYILKLYSIDSFENDTKHMLFGNTIHDVLEDLGRLNKLSEKEILTALQKQIQSLNISVSKKLFWIKKSEKIAKFLSDYELSLPSHKKFLEVWGEVDFSGKTLTAKADRIQVFNNDEIEIIDYKTGALPTRKELLSGLSPQLVLEAIIAEKNGFKDISGTIIALTYLRLGQGKKSSDNGAILTFSEDLDEIKNTTLQNLITLFLASEKTDYSYTANRENAKEKYTDYLHLERNEN